MRSNVGRQPSSLSYGGPTMRTTTSQKQRAMEYDLVEKINARHRERIDRRICETTGVDSELLAFNDSRIELLIKLPLSWSKSIRETLLKWALIWREENPELSGATKVSAYFFFRVETKTGKRWDGGIIAIAKVFDYIWTSGKAANSGVQKIPEELIRELRTGLLVRRN